MGLPRTESAPRDWDAATYARVCGPQLSWARDVIERLPLRGDERVIDAGCGSGAVTALLAERLPTGSLTGVDGSPAMIEQARRTLPAEVELIVSDLLAFRPDGQVDAVFSNATFHWIADHDALFSRIAGWLAPGGRLEAQCGGEGNVAGYLEILDRVAAAEPFRTHLEDFADPHFFAGPQDTSERLSAAGFAEVRCWLESRPARLEDPRPFVESVCLNAHLQALPPELRPQLVDAVVDELGPKPVLDYVRLNISAVRSDSVTPG